MPLFQSLSHHDPAPSQSSSTQKPSSIFFPYHHQHQNYSNHCPTHTKPSLTHRYLTCMHPCIDITIQSQPQTKPFPPLANQTQLYNVHVSVTHIHPSLKYPCPTSIPSPFPIPRCHHLRLNYGCIQISLMVTPVQTQMKEEKD